MNSWICFPDKLFYSVEPVWLSCQIINWKKMECGLRSQVDFLTLHPNANFGQPHGSFVLNAQNDFQFFQHRAAESLNLPKTVNALILAFQPTRNAIRQIRPGDFHNWKTWVLEGCPGQFPYGTKLRELFIAVDFEDCLRLVISFVGSHCS